MCIMATGDMKNNLMKLLREVRRMKIQVEPDIQGLSIGSPSSFLSLLHAALMHYSLPLANWFTHHGYDLYGRSDLRFLQELYRVLRDVFNYRPKLTREQFLSVGFAERKILMTRDVLLFCQAKSAELTALTSSATLKPKRKALETSKPSGRHGNTTHTTARAMDVLRIQERSSFFSGHNQSTTTFSADEPCSPPPTMISSSSAKLPQSISAPNELDVTIPLTPPPHLSTSPPVVSSFPLPQDSSPIVVHQPSLAQQDTSIDTPDITGCIIRHESPHSDYEPPTPVTTGGREDNKERESSPVGTGYWGSLSQQEGVKGKEDGGQQGGLGMREDGGQQQDSSEVFGNRVEQLTKMVEKLSAKFVLLETQLKLSQSQAAEPRPVSVEGVHSSCFESASEREDALREQPLRDITSQWFLNQQHCSPVNYSPIGLTGTTQQMQVKSEATPKSSASSTGPVYAHKHTPHSVGILHVATPSTPEETKTLIESLQARARETKAFLQLANSRMVHSS